jgi:hypothetical protein
LSSVDLPDRRLGVENAESLCGAEQMRFAVEVARRSNPKSKILIVDGIERIADDRLEDFIREATGLRERCDE